MEQGAKILVAEDHLSIFLSKKTLTVNASSWDSPWEIPDWGVFVSFQKHAVSSYAELG